MRILGIDPGTAIVGYAVVDYENGKYKPLDYGCIFTDKDEDMPVRLEKIYDGIENIIQLWKPADMAIEDLFFFKNLDFLGKDNFQSSNSSSVISPL